MGFRVQKSIRLGKHVRINFSKSGIGTSVRFLGITMGTGPRGLYMLADFPGTGLSYRKHWGGERRVSKIYPPVQPGLMPTPGFFASGHEKKLAKGLADYYDSQLESALKYFLAAAPREPGAAIMAATILAEQETGRPQAIELLEGVVQSEAIFPTPLMEKYLVNIQIKITIAPNVSADVSVNGLAAILLLVELYQSVQQVDQAIALLEEVTSLSNEPAVKLSLCDLYVSCNLWDEIIELAQDTESVDDITAGIMILYGRAMQGKGLHEAAVTVFNAVLRRKSGRTPLVMYEAAYWRATSYEAQGKPDQAHREWQRLYAQSPRFRDVARHLGIDLG